MITFLCACGEKLRVADELANCKARCPTCGAVRMVPARSELAESEPPAEVDGPPTISSQHDLTIPPTVPDRTASQQKDSKP